MAKWYGKIGFVETDEVERGIYVDEVVERTYFGDVISNAWKRQSSGQVNDNINLSNQISIVSDPYANGHCASIAYVEYMGNNWKVTNVEVQYPRLILSIGGVWNGNKVGATE